MDIVGRKFGMLTVVSRIDGTRKHRCICDCGKEKIIDCSNLVSGRQISCGCYNMKNCGCKRIRSKGENAISEYLSQTNTSFVSQYWFSDLRGNKNRPLYFDFALLNDKNEIICLIEYQGKQHYEECKKSIKDFGKRQREVTDKLKKKYCEDNNIKLFEISYKENITESVNKILNCLS